MRISDLLDGYQEDTIQLSEASPLSAERIKQLTMDKVRRKKGYRVKFLPKLAAAMIAVSILAVTAVAAEYVWGVKDWFGLVFDSRAEQIRRSQEKYQISSQLQGVVTQQHLAILESMGQIKNQSITSEGSTITLVAVCSDEYVMHLYFQVEAPEGVTLPDGLAYSFEKPVKRNNYSGRRSKQITVADNKRLGNTDMTLQALPDEDPGDNKKEFLLMITNASYKGSNRTLLNDGVKKTLNIDGLYTYQRDAHGFPTDKLDQTLFLGDFDFDITNEVESKRVNVDVKGIQYESVRTWYPDGEDPVEAGSMVTVDSLRIGPLSAEWVGDAMSSAFEVYMKDGTRAVCGGGRGMEWGSGKFIEILLFYLPVDIEQIDYVLIGGVHKVYIIQ